MRTWVFRKFRIVRRSRRLTRTSFSKKSPADYLKYKEQTRALVTQKIAEYNAFYNFTVGKIAIRNQRSRWGSCSKKGNLNFNYRLALLPDELASYVVVHELCHIGEFNHSKDFWNLVAQTMPNYLTLRKQLHQIKFGVV